MYSKMFGKAKSTTTNYSQGQKITTVKSQSPLQDLEGGPPRRPYIPNIVDVTFHLPFSGLEYFIPLYP